MGLAVTRVQTRLCTPDAWLRRLPAALVRWFIQLGPSAAWLVFRPRSYPFAWEAFSMGVFEPARVKLDGNGTEPEFKSGRKMEIPEKTRRPAASPRTITTCENTRTNPPEIVPNLPCYEASVLAVTPPWLLGGCEKFDVRLSDPETEARRETSPLGVHLSLTSGPDEFAISIDDCQHVFEAIVDPIIWYYLDQVGLEQVVHPTNHDLATAVVSRGDHIQFVGSSQLNHHYKVGVPVVVYLIQTFAAAKEVCENVDFIVILVLIKTSIWAIILVKHMREFEQRLVFQQTTITATHRTQIFTSCTAKPKSNSLEAARLYAETFPHRRHPERRTFIRIHQRLREYGTFAHNQRPGRPRSIAPDVEERILGGCQTGPHFIPQRLNGERYLHFLRDDLPTLLDDEQLQQGQRMALMHDDAAAHFLLLVRRYLNRHYGDRRLDSVDPKSYRSRYKMLQNTFNGASSLKLTHTEIQELRPIIMLRAWPPRSPELNPIDHTWDVSERDVHTVDAATPDLRVSREEVQQSWITMAPDNFRCLVTRLLALSLRYFRQPVHKPASQTSWAMAPEYFNGRLKERELNTKKAGIAAEREWVGMAITLGPCLPP
ncbi:hypothetical protein PR048_012167 [Dryococelus australis]|uniref:DUF4817 domain-containing protein n=1 Tax=Dryococelus australis TaxID=614101 RepID=A0ABQ9HNK4_9NEOP|nr:hypothetical protein PR048_012167 [Dryococelus australis]